MRKFILELEVDERIIEAGACAANVLSDLSEVCTLANGWPDMEGVIRDGANNIPLPREIRAEQKKLPANHTNWPILYTWKLKEAE